MLIGYVSDERYLALADVAVELEADGRSIEARSRATGAIHAEVAPGSYVATLAKAGYGSKRVRLDISKGRSPHQFRLLADGLLGYMWPKWVRAGEKAEFRVHSPEAYKLELWRYGGSKELVRPIGWYDEHGPRATVQITPDGDYTQTGVRWNSEGYTLSHQGQRIEAPARSGLYYLHARTASGLFFAFPWIVAPSQPSAPVAVLASNITWNAYNNFGGRNNYILPEGLPSKPIVNARQDLRRYTVPDHPGWEFDEYAPLSFDRPEPLNSVPEDERPTDPIEGRLACAGAPAEWRLLAWLERERFAYDLYAETQLNSGALNLDAYKVLVLSVHPEYWTREMYSAVKRWVVERGGRLMYLGGNGINCEVRLLDDDRMLVLNGKQTEPPGRGPESRFARTVESEANLLGVVFSETGIMTGAPYRAVDASHWVFEGTGVADGGVFGTKSLHMRCPGGASGHEQDKMSASSPAGTKLLAKGLNPDDGGAHMVTYETPSGGAVFSVGSITWPACVLVDEAVSRITGNVLRRFCR